MASWITPIFDRTWADVDEAIRQIAAQKNNSAISTGVRDSFTLMDVENGTTYSLFVQNGKLTMGVTEHSDSEQKTISLKDSHTGINYNLYVSQGKLMLVETDVVENALDSIGLKENTKVFQLYVADGQFKMEESNAPSTELKGCLNISDMNRIENNIQFLSDQLIALYYFSTVDTKTWDMSMLPTVDEIGRITRNVRTLVSSYFLSEGAPTVPKTMLSYEQVNHIEENLYRIKDILDDMINSFRECGTFNCGEE